MGSCVLHALLDPSSEPSSCSADLLKDSEKKFNCLSECVLWCDHLLKSSFRDGLNESSHHRALLEVTFDIKCIDHDIRSNSREFL